MAYTTNHTLLMKLREGDEQAWVQFRDFYAPLITIRGKDYRLTDEEIPSLIQDVLLACHQENVLVNYDRERGRFRSYLRTVISRCAIKLLKARPAEERLDEEALQEEASLDARWELECQSHLQEKALEELRQTVDPTHYMAFEMHTLNHLSAAETASALDLTQENVYVICSRCTAHLKEIVERLQGEL